MAFPPFDGIIVSRQVKKDKQKSEKIQQKEELPVDETFQDEFAQEMLDNQEEKETVVEEKENTENEVEEVTSESDVEDYEDYDDYEDDEYSKYDEDIDYDEYDKYYDED